MSTVLLIPLCCVCVCVCVCVPMALLPKGHGQDVVPMGKGKRVGPEPNPALNPKALNPLAQAGWCARGSTLQGLVRN